MENKSNRCGLCEYFDRYYTKGVTHFEKSTCGLCKKKRIFINTYDGCESYEHKTPRRRHVLLIRHALNDLLTELSALRLSLESEYIELE